MPNAHGKPQSIILFISFLWSFKRRFSVKQIDFGVKILPTFATSFFCKSMERRRTFFNKGVSKEKFRAERFCDSTRERNTRELESSTVSVDSALSSKVLFSTLQLCKEQCQERSSELFSSAKNINVKNANQSVFHILHCFFALSS